MPFRVVIAMEGGQVRMEATLKVLIADDHPLMLQGIRRALEASGCEVDMAGQLVESLHEGFRPSAFKNTYRDRLLKMIERKAKGEKIELPRDEQSGQSDDLMAALEASLGAKNKKTARR